MANVSEDQQQPHLVSLVLQSKKALQHGEQLCSRARTVSSDSAQDAIDVLALDAKLKWMTDAVMEQLKLAASVARSIELKRNQLEKQAEEWDQLRSERADSLDRIMDTLGTQVVPPDFHSTSADSSIFGSQHGSEDERDGAPSPLPCDAQPSQSPTETLRNVLINGMSSRSRTRNTNTDRRKWKTLRDFVDERAIEDMLENVDSDRNTLDTILARTADYPESLMNTTSAIQSSLPSSAPLPAMHRIFASQETASGDMAKHLTSLAHHFEQMSSALHDHEAGEFFSEGDLQAMNRDTDELPAIIADLEKNASLIHKSHEELLSSKQVALDQLRTHRVILDDLDELAEIMAEMLDRQEAVETESAEQLSILHAHLATIEDLYHRYTSYEYSFNRLLIEFARRRRYKEAAEKIVERMSSELTALAEEERARRDQFNGEHGQFLPADVCLPIQNQPTRWEVSPWNNEPKEILPLVDADLVEEAMKRISATEAGISASQSL